MQNSNNNEYKVPRNTMEGKYESWDFSPRVVEILNQPKMNEWDELHLKMIITHAKFNNIWSSEILKLRKLWYDSILKKKLNITIEQSDLDQLSELNKQYPDYLKLNEKLVLDWSKNADTLKLAGELNEKYLDFHKYKNHLPTKLKAKLEVNF